MAGQLIKRSGDLWTCRVFVGRDATGKRRYQNYRFRGTKKAAEAHLRQLLAAQDGGALPRPTRLTVNAFFDQWLATLQQDPEPALTASPSGPSPLGHNGAVRRQTRVDYADTLTRYVRPALGARPLGSVTALDLQALYADLAARGLSARTVRYTAMVVKAALRQAVSWSLLARNPAEAVKMPRQRRREMRALSASDARKFVAAAAEGPQGLLLRFALETGMRPEEYLAIRWSDWDRDAATIRVQRVLVRGRHRGEPWRWDEPKSAKARRAIPLSPTLQGLLLAEWRSRGAPSALDALIFPGRDPDVPWHLSTLHKRFKGILEAAGLSPSLRLYDLRHTMASLLLAQGIHPKIVSERLGHASVSLTLDTYSHLIPTLQDAAASALEAALDPMRVDDVGTRPAHGHEKTPSHPRTL